MSFFNAALVLLVGTACAALALERAPQGDTARVETAAAPIDLVEQMRPPNEEALMGWWSRTISEERTAPNDIVKDRIRARWNKAFCAVAEKLTTFTNWTGHVTWISSNGNFSVQLINDNVDDIEVFSKLEPSSRLFQVISTLKTQQPVRISGRIIPDKGTLAGCDLRGYQTYEAYLTNIAPLQ